MSKTEPPPQKVEARSSAGPRGYFITLPVETGAESQTLLRESVKVLWQARIGLVLSVLLFAGLAVAARLLVEPVYRSETVLAPAAERPAASALQGLAGQLPIASLAGFAPDAGTETTEALAILRSRAFTEAFIAEENLLPVLFADKWDAERGDWAVSRPEDVPTLNDGYRVFREKLRTITEDKASGLVTLQMEWKDPVLAARWANLQVERLNARVRQRVIAEARKSLDYLNAELEKTSILELRGIIYHLVEEQISNVMLANVREEYSFKQIDPAVPSEPDEYVWPNTVLMLGVGVAFGLFVGALYAMVKNALLGGTARGTAGGGS